jgi:hypothetical protein
MNGIAQPETLGAAIATEPLWLQGWVVILLIVHLAALAFVATRRDGRWLVRPEAVAILLSFVVAALVMNWLYAQIGYVRLLGLAHLLAWTPVWIWVFRRRSRHPMGFAFGWYLSAYLAIAGLSLIIDTVDVVRYVAGDGELHLRWDPPAS